MDSRLLHLAESDVSDLKPCGLCVRRVHPEQKPQISGMIARLWPQVNRTPCCLLLKHQRMRLQASIKKLLDFVVTGQFTAKREILSGASTL